MIICIPDVPGKYPLPMDGKDSASIKEQDTANELAIKQGFSAHPQLVKHLEELFKERLEYPTEILPNNKERYSVLRCRVLIDRSMSWKTVLYMLFPMKPITQIEKAWKGLLVTEIGQMIFYQLMIQLIESGKKELFIGYFDQRITNVQISLQNGVKSKLNNITTVANATLRKEENRFSNNCRDIANFILENWPQLTLVTKEHEIPLFDSCDCYRIHIVEYVPSNILPNPLPTTSPGKVYESTVASFDITQKYSCTVTDLGRVVRPNKIEVSGSQSYNNSEFQQNRVRFALVVMELNMKLKKMQEKSNASKGVDIGLSLGSLAWNSLTHAWSIAKSCIKKT